jgi:hypothetical protein
MRCNMGLIERSVRWPLGLAIIAFGVAYNQWWWVLGLIPTITALVGICPLYSVLGFDTTGRKMAAATPKTTSKVGKRTAAQH